MELTTTEWLRTLVPLVADLPQDIPEAERYRRLLHTLRTLFPCDAVALLRLDGDALVPLAIDGLSRDTLGRRFKVAEHPRFATLLAAGQPMRFEAHSPLPDPYDGLVEGLRGELDVHDCMGCALSFEGQVCGLLTLDSLQRGSFTDAHLTVLQAFGSLASATVGAALRINRLAALARHEHQRAESYRRAAGRPQRGGTTRRAGARAAPARPGG